MTQLSLKKVHRESNVLCSLKLFEENCNVIFSFYFYRSRPNLTSFERFQLLIRKQSLYSDVDGILENLLHGMASEEIVHIEQKEGGTQLKLVIDFESNGQAMFKPMR